MPEQAKFALVFIALLIVTLWICHLFANDEEFDRQFSDSACGVALTQVCGPMFFISLITYLIT